MPLPATLEPTARRKTAPRTRQRRLVTALGLGFVTPWITSLLISVAIALLYFGAHVLGASSPSPKIMGFVHRGTRILQLHSGAVLVLMVLFVMGRSLVRFVQPPWYGAALLLGFTAWLSSLPALYLVVGHIDPTVAFGSVLHPGIAALGAASAARKHELEGRLLHALRDVHRATSPAAIVEALGGFAHSQGVCLVLYEVAEQLIEPVAAHGVEVQDIAPFPRAAFQGALSSSDPARIAPADLPPGAVETRLRAHTSFWFFMAGEDRDAFLALWPLRRRKGVESRLDMWKQLAEGATLAWRNHTALEKTKERAERQERQRLSHELHDTLAQDLISALMYLHAAEAELPHSEGRPLRPVERILRRALTSARELAWSRWHEQNQDGQRLHEAIEGHVDQWATELGIAAECEFIGDEKKAEGPVVLLLLRTLRESLNNVGKHARARRVKVTLSHFETSVALDVHDDGVGVRDGEGGSDSRGGFGLSTLRECAAALGGSLVLESRPGEGTTLSVQLPRIPENP